MNATHLPPSPTSTPRQARVEACLEHTTLDACPKKEAEHRKKKESDDKLVAW